MKLILLAHALGFAASCGEANTAFALDLLRKVSPEEVGKLASGGTPFKLKIVNAASNDTFTLEDGPR